MIKSPCCSAPTYLTDIGPATKMRRVCSTCKATIPRAEDDALTAKIRGDLEKLGAIKVESKN